MELVYLRGRGIKLKLSARFVWVVLFLIMLH